MSHGNRDDHVANTCSNPYISEILERRLSRRAFVQAAGAAAALAAVPFVGCASIQSAAPGFRRIEPSTADDVSVPPSYSAQVLYRWGDPIGHTSGSSAFKPDASNSAAEQALQAGMHHDGMHYFPLPFGSR